MSCTNSTRPVNAPKVTATSEASANAVPGPPPAASGAPVPSAVDDSKNKVPPASLSADDARRDLRQLRTLLELSHPDPYLRSGGVLAFRKRFAEAEASIPEGGIERAAFVRLLAPLLAQVGDGHTGLDADHANLEGRVGIDLFAIDERLVVRAVSDPDQLSAVGATVEAIEGIPIATLVARMGTRVGHENVYGSLQHVVRAASRPSSLAALLERPSLAGPIAVDVRLANGTRRSVRVPVGPETNRKLPEPRSRIKIPAVDAADMASGFLDDAHAVAYFRIDSAMRYREAFETWRATGYEMGEFLDTVVHDVTGKAEPGDRDQEIALVPSVTERLIPLFTEMKARKTPLLLIDLRENAGGNSLFGDILEYFLYPLDSILAADTGYQVKRYSALYFESHKADLLEKVRARISPRFELGDFDFTEEAEWEHSRATPRTAAEKEHQKEHYIEEMQRLPTFGNVVKTGQWNATWTPRVVVLTSARTYSAGFDAVIQLRVHGASVAGVPSSQAANCFIDHMGFELTHSQVRGGMSFKWSVRMPDDPVGGTLLHPDRELTYAKFRELGFDPNATVILAMSQPARTAAGQGETRRSSPK